MRAITRKDELEFILRGIPEALPYLMEKGVNVVSLIPN